MTDNLLEVRGLEKTYQKGEALIQVLRGADLTIRVGDMVSVVGASGAGKSTLLHMMGTLDRPDQGDVLYRNQSLSGLPSSALADFRNRELGFVFQFHHLLPEFSALENVMMPALIRRLPRDEARALAEAALKEVHLGARMLHKPAELSGGEQQRVALARALVLSPPLILADEVTGNLDPQTGAEIHDLLFALNRDKGITMVLVTHNESLAERMPRKLLLEGGTIKELR